ncbi:hypothetical protein Agabi119p4_9540 [Agaricus bisporus var. burnettii]|uniref:Uncharacterized protein n=1 Tax=Agaricus bisporus var. burnettii TaxID=192524 RepID=A0A8H7C3L5_AGABI|nr:hypothetical protein Agabi119p4_9540 [Agaricus bisporus var. burnettii]
MIYPGIRVCSVSISAPIGSTRHFSIVSLKSTGALVKSASCITAPFTTRGIQGLKDISLHAASKAGYNIRNVAAAP